MKLTDILICPKTGNNLRFADSDSVVQVDGSDITYPVIDGIVDFPGERQDRVSASYDSAAHRYDAYMTSSTLFMKVCNTLIWGISDDRKYIDMFLSYLPSQFDGVLLDVPVGTGIFTAPVYAGFPDATIMAVDSSMGMLRKAGERFQQQGLKNFRLIRADVANLPVRDTAVDVVLSMNGWHAFADKGRAKAEFSRVLRKEGMLIACGYVEGAGRRADWFVKHYGVRNGFFTPPFFCVGDIARQFANFSITRQGNVKSVAYFQAVKKD